MRIIMEKHKAGIYGYCKYYVLGGDEHGNPVKFGISWEQAGNYAQAVRFWRETWGVRGYTAKVLVNAPPFDPQLNIAA